MSTTLTINVTGVNGGTAPGAFIRIDLNNCQNGRVIGSGQLVPQSIFLTPIAGIVTTTLFSNTEITCGRVNVHNPCGCDGNKVSYYSINFLFQGEVTSLGSYNLKPGIFNLWDITPCIGQDCICGNNNAPVPFYNQTPVGTNNGVNKVFTLAFAPKSLWLTVNGVYQTLGFDYLLVDNVISFFVAPPASSVMNAKYTYGACAPNFVQEVPAGSVNSSNLTFTLTHTPDANSLFLYSNGIYMTNGVDYNVSGNVITFVLAPITGTKLYAEYTYGQAVGVSSISTQVPVGAIDGVNTVFTITGQNRFIMLQQNQALLQPGVGFTQVGNTLTLALAPSIGDVLLATIFN
jgi:hypothetical protein